MEQFGKLHFDLLRDLVNDLLSFLVVVSLGNGGVPLQGLLHPQQHHAGTPFLNSCLIQCFFVHAQVYVCVLDLDYFQILMAVSIRAENR